MTGKQSVSGLEQQPHPEPGVTTRLPPYLIKGGDKSTDSPRTPFCPTFGCPLVGSAMWHSDCRLWAQDKRLHPDRHWQIIHGPCNQQTAVYSQYLVDLFLGWVLVFFSPKVSSYLSSISDPVWIHSGALGHPATPVGPAPRKGKLTHFKQPLPEIPRAWSWSLKDAKEKAIRHAQASTWFLKVKIMISLNF